MDVIWLLIKDDQFRDNPPNPDYQPDERHSPRFLPVYTADRPEVHDVIALMRRVLDRYDERLLIGEIYLPVERLVTYYGVGGSGVHLPYNFQLILLPWDAATIGAPIVAYEAALPPGGWPNWVLGNHDQSRVASRIGAAQARVAAMLLLTLRGTPTLCYGDEIGMRDVPVPPELVQDPVGKTFPGRGRDPERPPMQWDAGPGAGFTTGTPWLPLAADYGAVNVAAADADPASLPTLHRRLIALRRAEAALAVGRYTPLAAGDRVLAFLRDLPRRPPLPGRAEPRRRGAPVRARQPRSARGDRPDDRARPGGRAGRRRRHPARRRGGDRRAPAVGSPPDGGRLLPPRRRAWKSPGAALPPRAAPGFHSRRSTGDRAAVRRRARPRRRRGRAAPPRSASAAAAAASP